MNKITCYVFCLSFLILLGSCGGPKTDAKKLEKLLISHTQVFENIASDKNINEQEAKEVARLMEDMKNFNLEIEKKYSPDPKGKEMFETYLNKNEERFSLLYTNYYNSLLNLFDCEGSENLDL
ncbi:MAG: hypothetical protein GX793_05645 [Bacteroidales bacterium]|nr:hypothetical protein [Bacteroidales bacterium]